MTEIIVALITGVLAIIGAVITCYFTNKRIKDDLVISIREEFRIAQAVTDTKIEELTREVREHNNFAKRMPVVEHEIAHISEEVHTLQGYHTKK